MKVRACRRYRTGPMANRPAVTNLAYAEPQTRSRPEGRLQPIMAGPTRLEKETSGLVVQGRLADLEGFIQTGCEGVRV